MNTAKRYPQAFFVARADPDQEKRPPPQLDTYQDLPTRRRMNIEAAAAAWRQLGVAIDPEWIRKNWAMLRRWRRRLKGRTKR